MNTLRNIISLLSLAAIASTPLSGVLAPAQTGGNCIVKCYNNSCNWEATPDNLPWEPLKPDGCPGAGPSQNQLTDFLVTAPSIQVTELSREYANATSQPLYITFHSLLFYDCPTI
ncbi:MAG: hypothetical protein KI786_01685 [Mameliella sp.]|nr:hypothetical protein [Phaeodactylibacter sp.]